MSNETKTDDELFRIHNLIHQPHYALVYPESEIDNGFVVANRILADRKKQIEAELEALREEIKHEDLRTISQVITARIDKLKESSDDKEEAVQV